MHRNTVCPVYLGLDNCYGFCFPMVAKNLDKLKKPDDPKSLLRELLDEAENEPEQEDDGLSIELDM